MINKNIEVINNYINYLIKLAKKYEDYQEKLYIIFPEKIDNKYQYENEMDYDYFIRDKMKEYHTKNNKSIEKYINFLQNKNISSFYKSGIIVKNIPKKIKISLLNSINNYSDKLVIDYHPGSENKVIDIVHPSIYPLITNIKKSFLDKDYWGRPYENSKYQWLPSEFNISEDGKCKIESYINNLPITETEIYNNIEKIFEFILPQFENIWSYINAVKLFVGHDIIKENNIKYKELSLKNRNLQVITKIVKIKLNEKDTLEGAWHVEGMSHENIVATTSCTLEQDHNFNAKLLFKRKYTINEANKLIYGIHNTTKELKKILNEGFVPLGNYNLKDGSLIVFPNSHIHKLDMSNTDKSIKTRTIIVFWLINPDIKIKSTKDIKQQKYDIKKAYNIRLKLMQERRLYKNTFNIRDLNLCEH